MSEAPLDLAVLDMAGTTINEHGIVRAATEEAVREVADGQLPEDFDERFAANRGASKIAMFQALLAHRDHAITAHQIFEAALVSRIRDGALTAIDGAERTLTELRRQGLKIALITGFSQAVRDELMTALGWTDKADLILSPSDAGRGRPHPDLVLTAVLRLRATAVQSVLVAGDTTNDLLAGSRAGAGLVVGVLTGAHNIARLSTAPHTHILNSVAELPPLVSQYNKLPRAQASQRVL